VSVTRVTKRRGEIEWHAYGCITHEVTDLPGATTIMNQKAKPFLMNWMKKQGALAAIRNRDGLPTLLETIGEDAVVEAMAKAADKLRDDKGDTGTRAHAAIEALVKKQPVEITEDIGAHVEHFQRFLRDRQPVVKASEFMVISETHRYGATGDLAWVIDLREWGLPHEKALVMTDAKTGYIGSEVAFQLAAQRRADHSGLPDDPKIYAVPPATHFAALSVRADGCDLVPFDVQEDDWQGFLACKRLYDWDRTRSKKVMSWRSAA
jgi:hypothetical protein